MEQRGGLGPQVRHQRSPRTHPTMCEKMGNRALGGGSRSALGVLASFFPGDGGRPTSLPLGMLSLRLPATPISFY